LASRRGHSWRRERRSAYAAFLLALDDFWAHFPALDSYADLDDLQSRSYLDDRGVQKAFDEVWLIAPRNEDLRKAAARAATIAAQMRRGFSEVPVSLSPWPAPAIEFVDARQEFAKQARQSLGLPELPATGYGILEGLSYGSDEL
jgi:hypothetical protein